MVDATHTSFTASDRSYYAILKREAHNMALHAGFSGLKVAEIDIIIAEMTSNLYKYATGGEVLIGYNTDGGYMEIITMDDGPGIADVQRMAADGFSSANTMGHGLGSIKRLSDNFDIYSLKGWGTIVLSRVYKTTPVARKADKKIDIRALVIAKQGEVKSGDGFYMKTSSKQVKFMLADGLGHGPDANFAANEAVAAFKSCPYDSPVEILRYMHRDVRKTRGLVATVAIFDIDEKRFRIAGVGNISTKLSGMTGSKTLLSYNGIVGHNIPNTMNDHAISVADYHCITMCSDGIRSSWNLSKYTGIQHNDLLIQAAAIYKDHGRHTDDMSVVIAKVKTR